jgi:acylphosphatase
VACRLVRVRGRVQGVGFRDACVEAARTAGLVGWVRNRRDGSVELLIAGEPRSLDAYAGWLQRGVASARVDDIESVEASEAQGAELRGFERRQTA